MIAKLTIGLSLFALLATPLCAEDMGRLFYSPEQRAQLDDNYLNKNRPKNRTNAVILNGIVQKNGGKRTAWINGVAEVVGRSDERSPASVPVTIPGKSTPVKIKVGQTISLTPS
ncbi:MAG: hypothetical protein R8M11_09655, partial [Gallionella sp.]